MKTKLSFQYFVVDVGFYALPYCEVTQLLVILFHMLAGKCMCHYVYISAWASCVLLVYCMLKANVVDVTMRLCILDLVLLKVRNLHLFQYVGLVQKQLVFIVSVYLFRRFIGVIIPTARASFDSFAFSLPSFIFHIFYRDFVQPPRLLNVLQCYKVIKIILNTLLI